MLRLLNGCYSPEHGMCGHIMKREGVTPVSALLVSAFFFLSGTKIFLQSPSHRIAPKYKGGWESKYLACLSLQWKGARKKGSENGFRFVS